MPVQDGDRKVQRRVWRYNTGHAFTAVSKRCGNNYLRSLTFLHARHCVLPALDHVSLAKREVEWAATRLLRCVEHFPGTVGVLQAASVTDGDVSAFRNR